MAAPITRWVRRSACFADKNFANVGTAVVKDVTPYTQASPTITDASNLWNSFNRRGKSGGNLVVLTLDQNITGATPGDYIENNSNRMASFTMTNCYWHQTGVRVMVEGIQKGTFFHNTFDSVNGGLALVSDPYWAQGGTCQNVTVDRNVFRNCDVDKVQASGALVLGPYWGGGPITAGQAYGFQNFAVTNNTFTGPALEFVHAHAIGNLTVSRMSSAAVRATASACTDAARPRSSATALTTTAARRSISATAAA